MMAVEINGLPRAGRLPPWLRINKKEAGTLFYVTEHVISQFGLQTVCKSAKCPNLTICWGRGVATFMICGSVCTRECKFCAVTKGRPASLDPQEPEKVAMAVNKLTLKHVVITSVTRDDLPDGGANHFKETVLAIRKYNPGVTIEVLTPDFQVQPKAVETVLEARPEVFNHNLETVRRLTPFLRSKASYERSLLVLKMAKELASYNIVTKSGLMVGLGETLEEIIDAMADLRRVGCDIITIGQYLPPVATSYPLERYVHPEEFEKMAQIATQMGFKYVASGPFVRSSYMADMAIASIKLT